MSKAPVVPTTDQAAVSATQETLAPTTQARGWLPFFGASAPAAQTAPALVEAAAATAAPVQTPTTQARGWLPSWGAACTPAQATVPTTDQAAASAADQTAVTATLATPAPAQTHPGWFGWGSAASATAQAAPPAATAAPAPTLMQVVYARAADTLSGAAGVASSSASGLMSTASGLVLSVYEYWLSFWYGKLKEVEAKISEAQKTLDSLDADVNAGNQEAIAKSDLLRKAILRLEGERNEATSEITKLQATHAAGTEENVEVSHEVASAASGVAVPKNTFASVLAELRSLNLNVTATTIEGEGTSHVAAPPAATEANPVAAPQRVMPREYVAAHSQQTDAVAAALAVLQGDATASSEVTATEPTTDIDTLGTAAQPAPESEA